MRKKKSLQYYDPTNQRIQTPTMDKCGDWNVPRQDIAPNYQYLMSYKAMEWSMVVFQSVGNNTQLSRVTKINHTDTLRTKTPFIWNNGAFGTCNFRTPGKRIAHAQSTVCSCFGRSVHLPLVEAYRFSRTNPRSNSGGAYPELGWYSPTTHHHFWATLW